MPKYYIEVEWTNYMTYETDEEDEEKILDEIVNNGTLDDLCSGSVLGFSCEKVED